jgi:hypothetical protein
LSFIKAVSSLKSGGDGELPPISAPPPPTALLPPPQQGGDLVSYAVMTMNTNPYLIGIFMLLLNLGGRFLTLELTKKQEAFLQDQWVRPVIFFTVVFMATRNVVASFWLTVLLFFVIWVAANENSPFCMIPSWCGHDIDNQVKTYNDNVEKLSNF